MATTAQRRTKHGPVWSYSTGEWGKTRVRVYDRGSRGMYAEFWEDTPTGRKKVRLALGTTDREAAKAKADELALAFRTQVKAKPLDLTLATLFALYEREVTPHKGWSARAHDARCSEMFLRYFGRSRKPQTLSVREWDRFIHERRQGKVAPTHAKPGRAVGDRIIAADLNYLMAVLNWATRAGDGEGGVLLDRNPLKGLPRPRNESPKRPILTEGQYTAVLKAARAIGSWVELFVVLAHETGHRSASIRQLRWSDVDLTQQRIRWDPNNDKIGYGHTTPLTDVAVALLAREQRAQGVIGDAWIFPARRGERAKPMTGDAVFNLWARLAKAANLPQGERLGWHSLRRKFASELKATPLKDLCELGGWKNPQTVLTCYIKGDEATQREALANRRPMRAVGRG